MVNQICPAGMVLQKQEGAVHPDEPAFCINITEVPQEPYNRFSADQSRAGFELLAMLKNGKTERTTSPSEAPLRNIAATKVQRSDVSEIKVGPVITETRPQPEGNLAGPNKPAVFVSFQDALDYCQATYHGGNLPTGNQWDNACGDKAYCTKSGELKHTEARFDNADKGPGDVNWYAANKRGTKNMTGNVWEWTREDVEGGYKRIRGGSWYFSYFGVLRAAYRGHGHPGDRYYGVGFRCVAPPQDSKK